MAKRRIEGSRAIVTGASGGIGREIALELARQGAQQVLIARREEGLRQLAEHIVAEGRRVKLVVGDVSDAKTRQEALDAIQAAFGGLDILVNNAGIGAMGPFEDGSPQRSRRVMEVNFFAPMELIRQALPLLKQGTNPIIVNISSVLGHRGVPHSSEYCASKFALRGFSESIRAELRCHKIDVLVVSPGTTKTEFFDNVIEHTGEPSWPKHAVVSPADVARKTVRAIRKGRHEIIPHGWGKVVCWLNRLCPRLMDHLMARYV